MSAMPSSLRTTSTLHASAAATSTFSDLAKNWGSFGVVGIAFLDSAGFPTMAGPEALMMIVSYETTGSILFLAFVASLGAVFGTLTLYRVSVGLLGGEWALTKFGVSRERFLSLRDRFRKRSTLYGFLLGLAPPPLPKKAMTVIAGSSNVHLSDFVPSLWVGRWIRYTCLGYLGREYGRDAVSLLKTHKDYFMVLVLLLGIVIVLYFVVKYLLFRPRHRITRSASIDEFPEALEVLM